MASRWSNLPWNIRAILQIIHWSANVDTLDGAEIVREFGWVRIHLPTIIMFTIPNSMWLFRKYSVGVTTGVAFCGVVGHPQRHEYTVIGQKVNMAARLMMAFPGSVVSDETTKTKSGLAPSQFVLQPPVCLKGITNPENVYKFLTERYVSIKTSGRTCVLVMHM